jgi:hypothetical protein
MKFGEDLLRPWEKCKDTPQPQIPYYLANKNQVLIAQVVRFFQFETGFYPKDALLGKSGFIA